MRGGEWDAGIIGLLAANVRAPQIFLGDLKAQAASLEIGRRRLLALDGVQRSPDLAAAMLELIDYSERATRDAIRRVNDGEYTAEDFLDDMLPGGEPVRIVVRVSVRGDSITADFTGSAAQQPGPLNAVLPVTQSAVYYCIRCLLNDPVPVNDGCFRPVTVTAMPGSVVNANSPSAVSGGNVETSQRITDVVLRALAKALPDRMPAAGQGTMNNVTFGGWDSAGERPFVWYETLGGGMGAGPNTDGLTGVHVHMSNTRNSPIESIETELPVRIRRYAIRRETGGDGAHVGGDGLERVYEFLEPADGTVISERRTFRPWGLAGGRDGAAGENAIERLDGMVEALGSKARFSLMPGDRLRVRTPGGGGWGKPGGEPT